MVKVFYVLLLNAIAYCGYAQKGTIVLNVQGINLSKGGEISAGIFQKEDFPKVGHQFLGKAVAVSAAQMQIVFENVPAGTYALVAFQDTDKDKKLKTNMVGFPKEPIGFSNTAKIKFGPPRFDDAKVDVIIGKTLPVNIILQ